MALPQAIQRQADRAKEIEEGILSGTLENQEPELETPEVEDGSEGESPEDNTLTQDTPIQPEEPAEPEPQDPGVWEHKYRVLQGKYNAEVPRLHDEIKGLKESNSFLQGKMELLERLVAEKSAQPEDQQPEEEAPEVENLKENFPDIYEGVKKLLDSVANQTKDTTQKVEATGAQVNNVLANLFYANLANKVPDWETVNSSREFVEWLQQRERFTGSTKHELLMNAFAQGDADTVAEFFLEFKNESRSTAPNGNRPLSSKQVVPPTGKPSPAPSGTPSPTYKQSDIEEFYRQAALGKIPLKERNATEAKFTKAMQEGRILFNQ